MNHDGSLTGPREFRKSVNVAIVHFGEAVVGVQRFKVTYLTVNHPSSCAVGIFTLYVIVSKVTSCIPKKAQTSIRKTAFVL